MSTQDLRDCQEIAGTGNSIVAVFEPSHPYDLKKMPNQYAITARITDVSTAGSYWVVAPFAGDIDAIYTVLHGTIATADAVLSFELGGTAVTGGGITIAYSGSAAGDVDSATPTAANSVTAGQAIEIITNGASTNTVPVDVTFVISR